MSIAALITQGIGPGGSVPYLLTGGLDIGADVTPELGGTLIRRRRGRTGWRRWIRELEEQKHANADRPALPELHKQITEVQHEIRRQLAAADEKDNQQLALMERTLDLLNAVVDQAEEDELETLILLV